MGDILYISELGTDDGPDVPYPSFDDDGGLILFADENVVWRGQVAAASCVRLPRGSTEELRWTLPDTAAVTITDRRVALSCPKFVKVDKYWLAGGSSAVGVALLAISLAGLAATHRNAKAARSGKTAGAQLRFEWPMSVALPEASNDTIVVGWEDQDTPLELRLPVGKRLAPQLVDLVVTLVSRYRVANARDINLTAAARDVLVGSTAIAEQGCGAPGPITLPGFWTYPRVLEQPLRPVATSVNPTTNIASTSLPALAPGTEPGWFADPSARHPDRWWNGDQWTKWVRDEPGGTRSEDPPLATTPEDDALALLDPDTPEGWFLDPSRRHRHRWWDGDRWTKWVRDRPGGTRSEDAPRMSVYGDAWLTPLDPTTPEGWYPDPSGHHPDRWWNGNVWTRWVRDEPGGSRSEDHVVLVSPPLGTPEGWYSDPSRRHPDRWWNGLEWTKWVCDGPGGTRRSDPPRFTI